MLFMFTVKNADRSFRPIHMNNDFDRGLPKMYAYLEFQNAFFHDFASRLASFTAYSCPNPTVSSTAMVSFPERSS